MPRSDAHDARNAAFRQAFGKPFEYKESAAPTAEVITEEAKKLDVPHFVDDVPASKGARIHWLGDRSAKKVLLYFHGGGFCFPAFPGHVRMWNQCLQTLNPKTDIVIAALEYGLTKDIRYPVQITQGTEALRFILDKGYSPSDIAIGGDSGGGNLALGIISILLHGLNGIPPLKLDGPLAGVLLISPMVSFSTESESWTTNKDKDCVAPISMTLLGPAYVDAKDVNNYSEPLQADVAWWKDLPAKSVLNVYGEDECFKSHVVELGEKLTKAGNHVENVECPAHVHIDWVLDLQVGFEPGIMSVKILDWLSRVLRG
ncbi:Alpha/Beta hydrolase protein [Exophiala viscosa]|uniref:Alpha/Beta hydrolase protein n=1 Tax=Exophiala viscosa TaxID=2486360 RepID=UPI00218CBAF9|nr:Alpha/Beta hydrolase protein [Exophiala viscosa]